MSSSTDDTVTPALTDTLVPAPEQQEVEEKPIKEEDKNPESDYDSDDTVKILRAEYVLKIKWRKEKIRDM